VGNIGGRVSAGDLNRFLDIPSAATGAIGAAGVIGAGGAAADFLRGGGGATQLPAGGVAGRPGVGGGPIAGNRPDLGRPGTPDLGRPGTPDLGRPGTPGNNFAQNRPDRIQNRGERQDNRQQRRDEIRNQYHDHNPGDFWNEHPGWSAWAITRPYAWATWASLGSWWGYSGEAMPYAYGENVYYAGDQVYYGDQPVATTEQYTEQASALAASAPETPPQQGDWLPLGVFALTQDGQATGSAPSLYMQLALSKQGVISGTLKNTISGKVQALEGMADKKSQRVAWTVAGQQRPIMETGLSNLTQDTAPALIHFADGQTQQWLMVHIPEPQQ
jgi:hypothetical protein